MLRPLHTLAFLALLSLTGRVLPSDTYPALNLSALEQHLAAIDAQLAHLAHYTPRSGYGKVGYRSADYPDPDHRSSLRIDLDGTNRVDQLVLVPTIIRDAHKGFRPDGFPRALRILDQDLVVLSELDFPERARNGIAPIMIPLDGKAVSRLVIEATELSARAFDAKYVFQLAEVLAFDGEENVALGRPATASDLPPDPVMAWAPGFATDGALPYLMNSARGPQSLSYLSPRRHPDATYPLTLSVDLQEEVTITQINLHLVDQSDTIPQSAPDGIGMPHQLLVEGGSEANFSDARPLRQATCESLFDSAPILMFPLDSEKVRYLRFIALKPYLYRFFDGLHPRIGFAEIEVLSGGRNVTLGKTFSVPGEQADDLRPAAALTDGLNLFGEILPTRKWLNELALRDALERERPVVTAELARRYTRQRELLRRMIWIATLLAGGIGFTLLIDRILRLRALAQLRERFAADLHDELGANLHSIGLLSQLARKKLSANPGEALPLLERIDLAAKRSGVAVHHVTELQSASELYSNLEQDLRKAADRILIHVDHDIKLEGTSLLSSFPARTQLDLLLFYKECLINISRHSKARRAWTLLKVDKQQVLLQVTDDGRGLEGTSVPSSLQRRAKLLRATVSVSQTEEGSCITLRFRPRKWTLRPRFD